MALTDALNTMFRCSVKLEKRGQTTASAAVYFHKFFQICRPSTYDPYLIAATSLYLAGKVEEDHIKIRDIVNVFYAEIADEEPPKLLANDQEYWNLRESVTNCELLLLRMLRFQVKQDHPHSYLLFYLKSLLEWIGEDEATNNRVSQMCMALLNDFYMSRKCISYKPKHVALSVINIALDCEGMKVPYTHEGLLSWNEAFCEDLPKELLFTIIADILAVYKDTVSSYFGHCMTID